jgi:hypothetical protein
MGLEVGIPIGIQKMGLEVELEVDHWSQNTSS